LSVARWVGELSGSGVCVLLRQGRGQGRRISGDGRGVRGCGYKEGLSIETYIGQAQEGPDVRIEALGGIGGSGCGDKEWGSNAAPCLRWGGRGTDC